MKCNCQRWAWGILPLIVLCWLAVHFERGRIEQDLAERTSLALTQGGHSWAVAAVEGRDLVLSGRAPDEDGPAKASETLRGTWGVRLVDNRADLLERAENYIWAASRRGQRIRLTGYAPSLATRQVIIGVVRANFPGFEIVDRTRLARGVPPLDTWLAGISFGLRQLASLKRGDVRLDGLNMTVAGEAEDLNEYRTVRTALVGGLPKAIKLANSLLVPPSVSPHTWTARLERGGLTLTGYMPDETAGSELLRLIRSSSPGVTIDNRMQPASGAAAGWSGAAAAGVRVLLALDNGSAELKDATLTLSGLAARDTDLAAVRTALRSELPEAFKLSDQLKAPAPLIAPPAPPAPPLPPELAAPPPPVSAAEPPSSAAASPPGPPAAPAAASAPAAPPAAAGEPLAPLSRHAVGPAPIATQSLPSVVLPSPSASSEPVAVPAPPAAIVPPVDLTAVARASQCQDRLAKLAEIGPILFRAGSAELEGGSILVLEGVAGAAKTCPELRIEIAGHASAEGGAERNQQLSLERARSVVAYLVKVGVEEWRLEAVGYGAARPIAPNDNNASMARNRRIEFVVRRQH